MIKKYKQFNEGINQFLKGPTKEETWKKLGVGETEEDILNYYKDKYNKKEINIIGFYNTCRKYKIDGGPSAIEMWNYCGYDETFETPEEFFESIVDGLISKPLSEYPNVISYTKNNIIYFQYLNPSGWLYVNEKKIMDVLSIVFGLNREETIDFIRKEWKKYPNILFDSEIELQPIKRFFK